MFENNNIVINDPSSIFGYLIKNRIILLNGPIDDMVSANVVAQLLFLEAVDPTKDIFMYINSPGGSVTSGLSIYDTLNYITPDVSTICIGQASSMAALLLSSGAKGKRFALPSARIMIHQPLGGASGQATDIEIMANELLRVKEHLNGIMAKNSGKEKEKIKHDTERDNFMTAVEALEYGLVDQVISKRIASI